MLYIFCNKILADLLEAGKMSEVPTKVDEKTKLSSKEKIQTKKKHTEVLPDGVSEKKNYRKRKRHHFNAIRAQMEFYFSDANLSKDRFLKQLIEKEPFVPLEVFLTFNKIKSLTTDIKEIVKSLSNSELLQLDEGELKVCRKTPLPIDRNVDDKTLYIEAIPAIVDHDWVRKIFERFGAVNYVSLPKYSKSRKNKEFGFVEFEDKISIEKAVNAFNEFNGVLSMEDTDPEELVSIKSYIKEQNQEEYTSNSSAQTTQKREHVGSEENEPKAKKIKIEDCKDASSCTTSTENDTVTEEDNDADVQDGDKSITKKKSRKKKKNSKKHNKFANTNADVEIYNLKILPKINWKKLRNKYLNLQREKVSQLKRKIYKEKQEAQQRAQEIAKRTSDTVDEPSVKKTKQNQRELQKMNMNFYGAGEDDQSNKITVKEIKQNPALERAPLFTFAKGLIVEVNFLEPCVDIKEFKAEMRQHKTVKYVDIKEGAIQAYLRLEDADAAENFVRQINCAEYQCNLLIGQAENDYWKKIEIDREMKLNKKAKVPRTRGREKVNKLISKHLRFNDDDDIE